MSWLTRFDKDYFEFPVSNQCSDRRSRWRRQVFLSNSFWNSHLGFIFYWWYMEFWSLEYSFCSIFASFFCFVKERWVFASFNGCVHGFNEIEVVGDFIIFWYNVFTVWILSFCNDLLNLLTLTCFGARFTLFCQWLPARKKVFVS